MSTMRSFHCFCGIVFLVLLFPASTLASTNDSSTVDCPKGWFGRKCEFRCHCDPADSCDKDGLCQKCEKGWFGPACQYVDLIETSHVSTNDTTTTDDLCGSPHKWIHVLWDEPVFFTWLRLTFRDDIQGMGGITITLKETNNNDGTGKTVLDCTNQRTAVVDSKTMDMYCDVDLAITQVNISGPQLTSLCTVHISGGRNIALKQSTSQSSDYMTYTSDLAVDGDKNNDLEKHSCTLTTDQYDNPSWSLNFTMPHSIRRYFLYNRGMYPERLKGFTLEAFDADGNRVFKHTDTQDSPQPVYIVRSSSIMALVSQVKISAGKDGVPHLTLCEVEIYGDSVCPHGYFGRQCENHCNCALKGEQCFVSTGACPSGCPTGYHQVGCQERCDQGKWGVGCLQMCDYRCHDNQCDHADGHCTNGCKPGFQEPSCTKECERGTYGSSCTGFCPSNCKDGLCDIVTGKCHQCQGGYTGDVCDRACESGKYGQDCQLICSNQCLNHLCHNMNGSCINCPAGKTGDQCDDDCPSGWHGYNCNQTCSTTCDEKRSCDPARGHCLTGCQTGYHGETCSEKCPAKTYGASCKSNCSQGCQVKDSLDPTVCHHVTGRCHFGCRSRHERATCEPAENLNTVAIVVPVVTVVVFLLVLFLWRPKIVIFWIQRRILNRKGARDIEDNSETDVPLLYEEKDILEMENFTNDNNKEIENNLDLHRFGESLRRQ